MLHDRAEQLSSGGVIARSVFDFVHPFSNLGVKVFRFTATLAKFSFRANAPEKERRGIGRSEVGRVEKADDVGLS